MSELLTDGTHYVAFRGTDQTVAGWREDFMLSFQVIPAQKLAAEYLQQVYTHTQGPIIVGGHSKGGNLAVYAAMMCPDPDDRITRVYNNDGPGMAPDVIDNDKYQAIVSKITRILPDVSVVGMIYNAHDTRSLITTSSATIPLQAHDLSTWSVAADRIVTVDTLSAQSLAIQQILDDWLLNLDLEQRRAAVTQLFDAIQHSGAVTLDDITSGGLTSGGLDSIEGIVATWTHSRHEDQGAWRKLRTSFTRIFLRSNLRDLFSSTSLVTGILSLICGAYLLLVSELGAYLVWAVIASGINVFLLWRLRQGTG